MPDPTVVTDLTGGHLALLVRMEEYMIPYAPSSGRMRPALSRRL